MVGERTAQFLAEHFGSMEALEQASVEELQKLLDPLVKSSDFTAGGGLLIIAYDESRDDNTMGGGKVAWVVVGPGVKKGHSSTTTYQHESTLRLVSKLIGLPDFPGASASAPGRSGGPPRQPTCRTSPTCRCS